MSCSLECDKNLLTEKQNEQLNTIQPISFSKWVSFRKSKSFRRSFSSLSLNSENDNITSSVTKRLCSLDENELSNGNSNSDNDNDDDLDEDEDDLMNNISSPISLVCKACLYYLEAEIEATPEMLEKIIKNRTLRGLYEIIGFKYLTKILKSSPLPMDILYFYNCILLLFIIILLFNLFNLFIDVKHPKSFNYNDSIKKNLHYLNNLEGCSIAVINQVKTSYINLYALMLLYI